GVIDLLRHPVMADVEVLETALGLRAPVPVGRHLNRAEAVKLLPHPGGIQADRQIKDLRRPLVRVRHDTHPSLAEPSLITRKTHFGCLVHGSRADVAPGCTYWWGTWAGRRPVTAPCPRD